MAVPLRSVSPLAEVLSLHAWCLRCQPMRGLESSRRCVSHHVHGVRAATRLKYVHLSFLLLSFPSFTQYSMHIVSSFAGAIGSSCSTDGNSRSPPSTEDASTTDTEELAEWLAEASS